MADWLPGWTWRHRYKVTNAGALINNYQVDLPNVDTATMITAGLLQADADDIRVTEDDGLTVLSYWVKTDTINTATTKIWTKYNVPNGDSYVYVYYSNPAAANAEDYDNTFTRTDFGLPALIGRWHFDDAAGPVAVDDSGNGLTMNLLGHAWQGIGGGNWDNVAPQELFGPPDDHLLTDGLANHGIVPFAPTMNETTDVSAGEWINTIDAGKYIMTRYDFGPNLYWVLYLQPGGTVTITVINQVGVAFVANGGIPVNDGNWHLIGFSATINGNVQVYVDGVPDGAPTAFPGVSIGIGNPDFTWHWNIGARLAGFGDECIYYGIALDANMWQCIYERRKYDATPPTSALDVVEALGYSDAEGTFQDDDFLSGALEIATRYKWYPEEDEPIQPFISYVSTETGEPTIVYATDLNGEPLLGYVPFDLVPVTPASPLVTLAQLILTSLWTDREALPDDVIPDGTDDRRGWWADALDDDQIKIGSKLWLLMRAPVNEDTASKAKGYTEEGLQWMITDGIAEKFEIESEMQGEIQERRLALSIIAVRGDGTGVILRFPDLWADYE